MGTHKTAITTQSPLGVTAKIYIQEIARKNIPSYHAPYNTNLIGHSNQGKEIVVNSIGRYVFGVPGVGPHVRIVAEGNIAQIYYQENIETEVLNFINEIKHYIESTNLNPIKNG
jgi:hypothetical protein